MKLHLLLSLVLFSFAALAGPEEDAASYEQRGLDRMPVLEKRIADDPVSVRENCVRGLALMQKVSDAALTHPRYSDIMMLATSEPSQGYLLYKDEQIFFMRMDKTELRKMERCRRKKYFWGGSDDDGDGFSFTLDLGKIGKVNMVANQHREIVESEDGRDDLKAFPYTCNVKPINLTDNADARGKLNSYTKARIMEAVQDFEAAKVTLVRARKDYIEAAKRPALFGEQADKFWMEHNWGRKLVNAAEAANPRKYLLALENCKKIPSPDIQTLIATQINAISPPKTGTIKTSESAGVRK